MNKLIIISFFLTLSFYNQAQKLDKKDKKVIKKIEYSVKIEDYVDAFERLKPLISKYQYNETINYYFGLCKLHQKGNEREALALFSKIKDRSKFKNLYFHLGVANHWNGNFEDAIDCFHNILYSGKYTIDEDDILDKMALSHKSLEIYNAARRVEVLNLGSTINTIEQESVPVVLPHQQGMLFTSRRKLNENQKLDYLGHPFQDIYFANRDGYNWTQTPTKVDKINGDLHDAAVSISHDGTKFIFFKTNPNNIGEGDLYEADHIGNGKLENEKRFGGEINSDYIESSACYSPDGNTLYFSSNRPGGYGGFDLYKSKKLPNGEWGRITNLGATINTDGNEDAPFMMEDGITLLFASDGHHGMGGFDIFETKIIKEKYWKQPENFGYPINTVDHEMYISVLDNGRVAYYSSNREGGHGGDDIYKVILYDHQSYQALVKGKVIDAESEVTISPKITVLNEQDKNLNGIYRSNGGSGTFVLLLHPLANYQLIVEADGYISQTLSYSFEELEEINLLEIKLQPIKTNEE